MAVSTAAPTLSRMIKAGLRRSMKSDVPSFSCAASNLCRFESIRRKSNFPADCGISIDPAGSKVNGCPAPETAQAEHIANAIVIERYDFFMWISLSGVAKVENLHQWANTKY